MGDDYSMKAYRHSMTFIPTRLPGMLAPLAASS
jgi:hypothetical protein